MTLFNGYNHFKNRDKNRLAGLRFILYTVNPFIYIILESFSIAGSLSYLPPASLLQVSVDPLDY